MNIKKSLIVVAWIILLAMAVPLMAQQQYFIPPQVTAILDTDLPLKKTRSDIPFSYLQTLYLPAQQDQVYPIFLFQVKNADLNFAALPENPAVLKTDHFVFTRVYRMANGIAGEIVKERNVRFELEESQPEFQPDASNYYSIAGDIYPAGNYLLALVLTTPDFAKVSSAYIEFSLPDFSQLKDQLVTTPVISVKSLQMLPAADTKMTIHKNSFVYNTLQLSPILENAFQANESLDLFYFILGGKPDSATNAQNLQITYKFKKDGTEINKLVPQTVNSPIISQPIALTFTEVTKNNKGVVTESKEKLLEPGEYVLEIEMLDLVSKAKGLQEFKFKITQ
jgi:hypothetical protein